MLRSLFFYLLVFPLVSMAQDIPGFHGIQMNASVNEVLPYLEAVSEKVRVLSPEEPRFPLASLEETHLLCSSVRTDAGVLEKVVFTFADNRLKYVEARGNAAEVFKGRSAESPRSLMDYEVYFSEGIFINNALDAAWVLSEEAVHPNLFTWENPFLKDERLDHYPEISDTEVPEFITMGAGLEEISPLLDKNSSFTFRETLDGSDPNAQLQINGFGVNYMGFPRKVEARFGDNKLNVVWILTGKGEESRIREALKAQFGEPVYENDDWEIYNNWKVGLRKDKPEVLLMEQSIGLHYKSAYFNQ